MRLKRVDAISEFLANWFTAESSHLSNWQELVLSLLREFVDKRRSDAENLVRGRFMACSVKWDAIRYIGKNVYMISITCHQHDICIRKCIYIYIFDYICILMFRKDLNDNVKVLLCTAGALRWPILQCLSINVILEQFLGRCHFLKFMKLMRLKSEMLEGICWSRWNMLQRSPPNLCVFFACHHDTDSAVHRWFSRLAVEGKCPLQKLDCMVWKGHKTILKIFNNVRGVQHFGQPRSLCAASNLSSQVTLYCKKSDVIDMMWAYNVSQDLPAMPPSSTYRFVGYSNFLLTGSVAAETNSFQKIAAKSTVHKVNTPLRSAKYEQIYLRRSP